MDYALARLTMVRSQLATNKVTDERILRAIQAIPRENFVGFATKTLAYSDEDLEIKSGRYLMEPLTMGRIFQGAMIGAKETVLVIGAGSGYMAAVAGKLAKSVLAVESDQDLVTMSETTMTALTIDNVVSLWSDPKIGYANEAPYNVILVDGAVAEISPDWVAQLAEGGRMLVVEQHHSKIGHLVRYLKNNDNISGKILYDCAIKPLPDFEKQATFQL